MPKPNGLGKLWPLEENPLHSLIEQYSPAFSLDGKVLFAAQVGDGCLWQMVEDELRTRGTTVISGAWSNTHPLESGLKGS